MQRNVIDRLVGMFEYDPLPFRIGLHVGIRRAAHDQFERSVEGAQCLRDFVGEAPIFVRRLVADLPWAVHLVAEAPVLDAERRGMAVLLAKIAPVAARRPVHVFDKVARLVETARTEVDCEHHLGAGGAAPLREFMHADRIGLGRVPREIEPCGALFARPHAVFPIVGGHEIASGIAHNRDLKLPDELDHIGAHAVGVGAPMPGLIDAGVNRTAEMLEKGAVDPVVDFRDAVVPMGCDGRFHASSGHPYM